GEPGSRASVRTLGVETRRTRASNFQAWDSRVGRTGSLAVPDGSTSTGIGWSDVALEVRPLQQPTWRPGPLRGGQLEVQRVMEFAAWVERGAARRAVRVATQVGVDGQ